MGGEIVRDGDLVDLVGLIVLPGLSAIEASCWLEELGLTSTTCAASIFSGMLSTPMLVERTGLLR